MKISAQPREVLLLLFYKRDCKNQNNPRVRKIRVRNSGAGDGCANFMDAWKMRSFCRKTHVHKIPRLRGGGGYFGFFWGGGGGSVDFIFMGARIFLKKLGRTFTRLTRVSLVTRVSRRFFWGPFWPKTQENKQKISREALFLIPRQSRVARNSGDSRRAPDCSSNLCPPKI